MKRGKGVLSCLWMVLAFVIGSGIIPAPVFADEETDIYGFIESFTWREFSSGEQLLRESGPLGGIGFSFISYDESTLAVKARGELFGGQVHYVGQACDIFNNCEPATSNADYFGIRAEGDVGPRFKVGSFSSIEPFAGAGLRMWIRHIKGGTTVFGNPVSSVTEDWTSVYFRLGIRGDHDFSKRTRIFAEAGVTLPVYNTDYSQYYNVTVKPGNKPSLFAEAGMKVDRMKISAFYEGLRFGKSEPEFVGFDSMGRAHYVFQPKTNADIYGIRVGVIF